MAESLVPMAALAFVVFAAVWWLAAAPLALMYAALRRPLGRLAPRARARALLVFSGLSLLLGAALSALLFLPANGAWLVSSHCHEAQGCGAHTPSVGGTFLTSIVVTLALLIAMAAAARLIGLLRACRRRLQLLVQVAVPVPDSGYSRIDCDTPFAFTAGLLSPQIFVSTGLEQRLDGPHLHAVVVHEQTHVRRRDNLRHTLATFWAPTLLTGAGRPLLGDLCSAAEQCCDAEAAKSVRDPHLVADALIWSQRAIGQMKQSTYAGTPSDMPARIAQLIEGPSPPRLSSSLIFLVFALVAATALLGVNTAHHVTEMLLALLHR